MGGNPFGKDVYKYGSEHWQARRNWDEWRARKTAPLPSSKPSIVGSRQSPIPINYGSATVRDRSGDGGGLFAGLAKLIVGGFIFLAVVGYFESQPNSARPPLPPTKTAAPRESDPTQPSDSATHGESQPSQDIDSPQGAAPVPSEQTTTAPSLRLPENDERVLAAINDLRMLSGQTLFVGQGGDVLVVEGRLDTPERNLYQSTFNVADLDLPRSTYPVNDRNLNIPCKANAACITYAVYEGSTEETAGELKDHSLYGSVNLWSQSEEDASRILQDFQRLQSLQQ